MEEESKHVKSNGWSREKVFMSFLPVLKILNTVNTGISIMLKELMCNEENYNYTNYIMI